MYLPPVPPLDLGPRPTPPPEPLEPSGSRSLQDRLVTPSPLNRATDVLGPSVTEPTLGGESPPDLPPPIEGVSDTDLEALYLRHMMGQSQYSPEEFSARLPELARGRFSLGRVGYPKLPPALPELPLTVQARPPTNELIHPTGGYFNPNVDYTTSLKSRILNTLGSSVAPAARELLDSLPIGFEPALPPDVAAAAQISGDRPSVLLSPSRVLGGIETTSQSIAALLRHEVAHHYVSRWSPERVKEFLNTQTVRQLPVEAKKDWPHIFTFLGGMGESGNTALHHYFIVPIPRYVEDLPEDLRPFYKGFLPDAPPDYYSTFKFMVIPILR